VKRLIYFLLNNIGMFIGIVLSIIFIGLGVWLLSILEEISPMDDDFFGDFLGGLFFISISILLLLYFNNDNCLPPPDTAFRDLASRCAARKTVTLLTSVCFAIALVDNPRLIKASILSATSMGKSLPW
jgi:hypothetical protein